MASPFVGEIKMVGCNFAPRGYALCDGQLLSIAQNTALFSILGTTYGGDGRTTFGLPNMQGRAPMHWGSGPGLSPRVEGELAGVETVTLITSNLPVHTHTPQCATATGNKYGPGGNLWAPDPSGLNFYLAAGSMTAMASSAIAAMGGGTAHPNIQPSLTINFIVALQGIFPSRN